MYSRDQTRSTGAVKAFEDAFAKEDFLRRTGTQNNSNTPARKTDDICEKTQRSEQTLCNEQSNYPNNYTAKHRGGLAGLFSDKDSGDILLALLVIFFLLDSDKENDSLIPILLAILLFF